MPLDDLEILFDDLDFDEPTKGQIYKMYGIFLDDFKKNILLINNKEVKINTNPSRHPLFTGKFQTFVHIVTRENTYNNRRQFDRDRANRIHWIRPILENIDSPAILFFERRNDQGENQHYYWYAEKEFIVILREIEPDLLLLTSFCVDNYNKRMFKKWNDEYQTQKKTPLRK